MYSLIYRKVPIKTVYFGGECQITLYNLCFSSIIFLLIYIHNMFILLDLLICLIYAFVLIWLGLENWWKRSVSPFIGVTLPYATNLPVGAALNPCLGLVFMVSLSTCGCWYVNGTLGELEYIVEFSFRLWHHNRLGNFLCTGE